MEPLAALSPMPGHGQVYPAPLTPTGDRDSAATRVAGQSRPVELSQDRVDAGDQGHGTRRPVDARREQPAPLLGAGRRTEGGNQVDREASLPQPDLSAAGVTAHNHGVTYKVYPDLSIRIQGRVVDRSTTEVVREIPDDRRIDVARRYQQYIGNQVDLQA